MGDVVTDRSIGAPLFVSKPLLRGRMAVTRKRSDGTTLRGDSHVGGLVG